MEHKDLMKRSHQLLCHLSCLPEKIVAAHDVDNLAEFVLYELCHPACFNFKRAAFFVDNPDFDCLRGIVGVSTDEHALNNQDIWKMYENFSKSMKDSSFNASVRAVSGASMAKSGLPVEQEVTKLLTLLPFKNPEWRSFKTKHGNRGILIFERTGLEQDLDQVISDHILSGAALLAFCPIF